MSFEITEKLVKRSQKGDAEAFGELYEMYAQDMFGFAYYYTSSSYFAQEAVSEAVLVAFKNIRSLKKAESFKSWLFKILFNCCKKQQKEKAEMKRQADISALENSLSFEISEENADLSIALDRLSSEEKEIILMSFVCGYKSEEIGKILSMKSSTVRSKRSRAVMKIRTFMLD